MKLNTGTGATRHKQLSPPDAAKAWTPTALGSFIASATAEALRRSLGWCLAFRRSGKLDLPRDAAQASRLTETGVTLCLVKRRSRLGLRQLAAAFGHGSWLPEEGKGRSNRLFQVHSKSTPRTKLRIPKRQQAARSPRRFALQPSEGYSHVPHQRSVFHRWRSGMTLLEMLLAMAILGAVLLVIGHTVVMMENTWTKVRGKADGFRNTRLALDLVAHRISQATLNTRWKSTTNSNDGTPEYETDSDLHFVSGPANILIPNVNGAVGHAVFFQAPFGQDSNPKEQRGRNKVQEDLKKLNSTLNAWGYFVEYGKDDNERPLFMGNDPDRFIPRWRCRLLEFRQPARELSLFDMGTGTPPTLQIDSAKTPDQLYSWFRMPLQAGVTYQERHLTVVAENILAFIITPLDPKKREANSDLSTGAPFSIAPNSTWNSRGFVLKSDTPKEQRHSLPPAVQLTAIAVSEDAWMKYSINSEDQQAMIRISTELMQDINNRFQRGETLATDIAAITDRFDAMRPVIPYQIMTILVPIAEQ